jgi:tRNA (mo5U34)-methyltransferase
VRTLQSTAGELAPWFHNLHLPDGRQTAPDHPLGDFPAFKWRQIAPHVPRSLAGTRALDIGCNAGFYSFELAKRGASVLAVDVDEHYLSQGRWAAEQLDPHGRVEFREMTVYDLAGLDEQFDVVLFLGVLYHLRHPLLALDIVAERVRGRLLLQTLTIPGGPPASTPEDVAIDDRDELLAPGWPRVAFIERHLAGDPTNWWAPDDACVRAMARSAGMRVIASPAHEVYICEPDRSHDPAGSFRRAELDSVLGASRPGTGSTRRSGSTRSG